MKLNKLPLNVIGLNRVGLNQIGSPSHRANTSARPYIDPEVLASLVAVCICDGKSNNDPDRAVIKNLVDPAMRLTSLIVGMGSMKRILLTLQDGK